MAAAAVRVGRSTQQSAISTQSFNICLATKGFPGVKTRNKIRACARKQSGGSRDLSPPVPVIFNSRNPCCLERAVRDKFHRQNAKDYFGSTSLTPGRIFVPVVNFL